jgi:hypothetical protein
MWIVAQTGKLENTQGDDPGFCAGCNMKFGIDERGPWREAMVPRAALEWLAGISEGCAQVSPCPANKPLSDANKEALCRECLMRAALKAAEEASDDA